MEISILTSKKTRLDEPLDLALPHLPNVKVYEVPYLSRFKSYVSNLIPSQCLQILKRVLRKKSSSTIKLKDHRDVWAEKSIKFIEKLGSNEFDIVVSTSPPFSCHEIASKYMEKTNRAAWIADYRDLWSVGHLTHVSGKDRSNLINHEKETLALCTHFTTVSDPLRVDQSALLGLSGTTIYNGYMSDVSLIEKRIRDYNNRERTQTIKITYAGIIYPTRRDPMPLIHAIQELSRKFKISIEVNFWGHIQASDIPELFNKKYSNIVKMRGYATPSKIQSEYRSSDFLLLLESPESDAVGVVPGKLFEYLEAGRPIISVGSKKNSTISEIIEYTETGFLFGSSRQQSLKKLTIILESWHSFVFKPSLEAISEFSRKRQSMNMKKLLDSMVKR